MSAPHTVVRRRSDGEETRRRVLDAVVETVVDVGYYKASSNEIARRAGVTWGAIHHLFGSREQLMLDVFHDLGEQNHRSFTTPRIEGASLEDRLRGVADVLAAHYEQPRYIVEVQISLDFASNPRVSEDKRQEMRRRNAKGFPRAVQPLLAQALGESAPEDLCVYAFTALHGYLFARAMLGQSVELSDDSEARDLLVVGIASSIRTAAARRGIEIDDRRRSDTSPGADLTKSK